MGLLYTGGLEDKIMSSENGKIIGLVEVPGGFYDVEFLPSEEGGYVVIVPALDGCATEGDTLDEAQAMIVDAVGGWLAVAKEEGLPIPEPKRVLATVPA